MFLLKARVAGPVLIYRLRPEADVISRRDFKRNLRLPKPLNLLWELGACLVAVSQDLQIPFAPTHPGTLARLRALQQAVAARGRCAPAQIETGRRQTGRSRCEY